MLKVQFVNAYFWHHVEFQRHRHNVKAYDACYDEIEIFAVANVM